MKVLSVNNDNFSTKNKNIDFRAELSIWDDMSLLQKKYKSKNVKKEIADKFFLHRDLAYNKVNMEIVFHTPYSTNKDVICFDEFITYETNIRDNMPESVDEFVTFCVNLAKRYKEAHKIYNRASNHCIEKLEELYAQLDKIIKPCEEDIPKQTNNKSCKKNK